MQNRKAVTAYIKYEQLLHIDFASQNIMQLASIMFVSVYAHVEV